MKLPFTPPYLQQTLTKGAAYLSGHRLLTGVVVGALALLLLAVDFNSPVYIEYSVVYTILIAFATQFVVWKLGLALALLLPAGHFGLYFLAWHQPYPLSAALANLVLLLFAGIATVYLLRLAQHRQELRRKNMRLETLEQTMITVNDIVLNRLQVLQFILDLTEQGKPISAEQIRLGKAALEDVAARLREVSELNEYETAEVTAGVRALRVPQPAAADAPATEIASTEVSPASTIPPEGPRPDPMP